MNRLPIRFEQEVLKKHGIEWYHKWYYKTILVYNIYGLRQGSQKHVPVSEYELAGIALAEILPRTGLMDYINQKDYFIHKIGIYDKDFCTCVFKAVDYIYKDRG